MFTVSVRGSYPKQPTPPRPYMLGRGIDKWHSGSIEIEELERYFQRFMVEIAAEYVAAGVDVIWDGQVRWDGPADYIFRKLKGFKVQPDRLLGVRRSTLEDSVSEELERDSGNGHHPQTITRPIQAVAESRPEWIRPILVDDFRFMQERTTEVLRPALTGPISLAQLCDPGIYADRLHDLAHELAKALNRELLGLEAAGAKYILIEEPLIFGKSEDSAPMLKSLEVLCNDITATVFIACGNLSRLEEDLAASNFGGVCFDLTDSYGLQQAVAFHERAPEKLIEFGLISGRNRRLDDEDRLFKLLAECTAQIPADLIWISPTGPMGSLTRETAFEKLQMLYRIAERARRELTGSNGQLGTSSDI